MASSALELLNEKDLNYCKLMDFLIMFSFNYYYLLKYQQNKIKCNKKIVIIF